MNQSKLIQVCFTDLSCLGKIVSSQKYCPDEHKLKIWLNGYWKIFKYRRSGGWVGCGDELELVPDLVL